MINQALGALGVSSFWTNAVAGALLLLAIAFDRWVGLRGRPQTAHRERGPSMTAATYEGTAAARPAWRSLLRWETGLVFVLVAVLIYGQQTSTHFFTTTNIFFIGLNMGEIAIMALPLTLIVVVGEIDLSVASMLGLSSTLHGLAVRAPLADPAGHARPCWWSASLGGALNGWLVTGLGLPSIAVTIGTLALFRGLAEISLKDKPVSWSRSSLPTIGTKPVPGPSWRGRWPSSWCWRSSTASCCTRRRPVARCTRSACSRRRPASPASE